MYYSMIKKIRNNIMQNVYAGGTGAYLKGVNTMKDTGNLNKEYRKVYHKIRYEF